MGSPDPVKEALEKAAARAARVAVLDAAGQEPSPSDLRAPCARLRMWQDVFLETTLVTSDFKQKNAKDIEKVQVTCYKYSFRWCLGVEDWFQIL